MRLVSSLALVLGIAALGCDAAPPADPVDQGPFANPNDPWEPDRHGLTYDACAFNAQRPFEAVWHGDVTFDAAGNIVGGRYGWAGKPPSYTAERRYADGHFVELRETVPDQPAPFVIDTYVRNGNGVVIREEIDGDFALDAVTDGHPDRARHWRYDDRDLMVGFDFDDDGDGMIEADHVLDVTYRDDQSLATIDERRPDGGELRRYEFDAEHRLARIESDQGRDGTVDEVVTFTYDQWGRRQHVITNGVRETYEYAGSTRPVHLASTTLEYWWGYACNAARAPTDDTVDRALVDALAPRLGPMAR